MKVYIFEEVNWKKICRGDESEFYNLFDEVYAEMRKYYSEYKAYPFVYHIILLSCYFFYESIGIKLNLSGNQWKTIGNLRKLILNNEKLELSKFFSGFLFKNYANMKNNVLVPVANDKLNWKTLRFIRSKKYEYE